MKKKINKLFIRIFACFIPNRQLRDFVRLCRFGRYKITGENNVIMFAGHKLPRFLKIPGLKIIINGQNNLIT